jgi:hypothetical protein
MRRLNTKREVAVNKYVYILTMRTPFFPAFRPRLAALGQRAQARRPTTMVQLQHYLGNFLPLGLLAEEEAGPGSRDRIFNLRLTFECFLWQLLKPKTSCREVVRQVQALFRLQGRAEEVSASDSAFIQARLRLPKDRLERALTATAQAARQRAPTSRQLGGRPVKVVDGSTTQLPDTVENQKRYPQSRTQKPGCGFPVLRFVVLFCLNSGVIFQVAYHSLRSHDLRLFRQLWDDLKKGDIVLGDRAFGDYTTLAGLPRRGVDVVARLHARRKVDFRKANRLAKNDGLFLWRKGAQQSSILDAQEWELLPEETTVRIIRFTTVVRGFRGRRITLVTTLLDAKVYPATELMSLYARRWHLELCLRDLKTTLGLEQLRCKSPDMAEKELLAYLIVHNLIRCIMAETLVCHEVALERLSFKGTVDALRQYSAAIAQAKSERMRHQLWDDLLFSLARDLVPDRPHRREPRAVKRRPKPYPLLNQPRRKFVEISHRSRYWKGRPRNFRGLN